MKASLDAHAVARESSNQISIAVARSIGQAVATAHMAETAITIENREASAIYNDKERKRI